MNLETIGLAAVCAVPLGLFLTDGQEPSTPPPSGSQVEGLRADLAELERRIAEVRAERAAAEHEAAEHEAGAQDDGPDAHAERESEVRERELERASLDLRRKLELLEAGLVSELSVQEAQARFDALEAEIAGDAAAAERARRESRLTQARLDLERRRALYELGLVSELELRKAEAAHEAARTAPAEVDAAAGLAEVRLAQAQLDLERKLMLFESGLVSTLAMERAKAELEAARAALGSGRAAEAEARLEIERAALDLEELRALAQEHRASEPAVREAERALERARAAHEGRDLRELEARWAAEDLERVRVLAGRGLAPESAVRAAERALERARAAHEGRDLREFEARWAAEDLERVRVLAGKGLAPESAVRAAERALERARAAHAGRDHRDLEATSADEDLRRIAALVNQGLVPELEAWKAEDLRSLRAEVEREAAARAEADVEEHGQEGRRVEVRVRTTTEAEDGTPRTAEEKRTIVVEGRRLAEGVELPQVFESIEGQGGTVEGLRFFVLGDDGELREVGADAAGLSGVELPRLDLSELGGRLEGERLDHQVREALEAARERLEGTPFEIEIEVDTETETGEQPGEGQESVEIVEGYRIGSATPGADRDVTVEGRFPSTDEGGRRIRFEPVVTEGPDGEVRVLELRRTPQGWTEVEGRPLRAAPDAPQRVEVRGLPGRERSVQVFEFRGRDEPEADGAWSPDQGPDAGPRRWVFHGEDGRIHFGRATLDEARIEFEDARVEGFGRTATRDGGPDGSPFDRRAPRVDGPDRRAPAPQVWFVDRDGNEFRGPGAAPPGLGRRWGGPDGGPGSSVPRPSALSPEGGRGPDGVSALDREFAELLRELNVELRAVREELAALRRAMDGR